MLRIEKTVSLLDDRTRQAIVDRVFRDRARRPEILEQMRQRQQQGWAVARRAAHILKTEFGVERVVLFGSMLDVKALTWRSDIDLAVWGLAAGDLFKAGAAIERGHEFGIDLVPIEEARPHILSANCRGCGIVTLSLSERIREELTSLQQAVSQTEAFVEQLSAMPNERVQEALVNAIALNLHAFYTGTERIFSEVAKTVDGSVPAGNEWHRLLLLQMAAPLPDLRAAVISEALLDQLDELRRFRHVVRSNYAHVLNRQRVLERAEQLGDCWDRFQEELEQWLHAQLEG